MTAPRVSFWVIPLAALALPLNALAASKTVSANGYLDFRKPGAIIVDGQRVLKSSKTKFKGSGAAKAFESIPLGYEVKVEGTRQADGAIMASKIEAKPNGIQSYETEVLAGTNAAEAQYKAEGKIADKAADGTEQVLGKLITKGPEVDRARRIMDRLLPGYVRPESIRVYVVENKEWNAMAMANYSIYVFTGIMKDLDDDEMAIVLGHELTHATHEHSRRQAAKSVYSGIAGTVAQIGLTQVKSGVARDVAGTAAGLGVSAFGNSYSRDYEDQADRVGLRYVYEAGFDYKKAPGLWRKFAQKYADSDPISNFFFGNHSLSSARAAALQKEIDNNYKDPSKDPPSHAPKG